MSSLKSGESFATGMVRPRTTALFYDKLWVHPALMEGNLIGSMEKYAVPAQLCISEPLGIREYYLSYGYNAGVFTWDEKKSNHKNYKVADLEMDKIECHVGGKLLRESGYNFQRDSISEFQDREDHEMQPNGYSDTFGGEISTKYRNRAIRDIVSSYAKKGIALTPIYLHPTEYDKVTAQEKPGLEICLDFIPVVLDSKLTWKQVLEFRKDKKAREKLNRLKRWFTIDLLGKSEHEIKSTIGQKLDDYQWALKKHGIQTAIAGATSVLSFVAGPTLLSLITASPLTAIVGGVAIGSGAVAWIANRMIDKTEIQREEIAYIYEVRKLLA
jgi:hypothetical protein